MNTPLVSVGLAILIGVMFGHGAFVGLSGVARRDWLESVYGALVVALAGALAAAAAMSGVPGWWMWIAEAIGGTP